MARMLQALKNLEARSPKPAAAPGGVLAHLADSKQTAGVGQSSAPSHTPLAHAATMPFSRVEEELSELPPEPPVAEAPPLADAPPLAEAPPAAKSIVEPVLTPVASVAAAIEPAAITEAPVVATPPPAPSNEVAPPLATSTSTGTRAGTRTLPREPTKLEQSVRRTLSDRARAAPLRDMADRLLSDARQSSSQTLLAVGIGWGSTTHEALLYAGALLADRAGETLLIDADVSRRLLSEGLEAGQEPGLAELLRGAGRPRDRCRTTGIAGLSLLPAGLLRSIDLSTAGSRLGEILHELAADFSLILIDGGRSGDLAASTLARLCDATYLVVQLGAVEANEAQAALRDFRAGGARVLGCIAT